MKQKNALIVGMLFLTALAVVAIFEYRHLRVETLSATSVHASEAISSRIEPPLDLRQLTDAASFIIVGQVIELTPVGKDSQTASEFRMFLTINKVLKGSVRTSSLTVSFARRPDRMAFTRTITPLMYVTVFLKAKADSYVLAESNVEALAAVPGGADIQGDALDRVINELGNVLASSASSNQDKIQSVRILSLIDSKAANDALRRTVSLEGNVRSQVDAALLRHNDISTLRQLEGTLLDRTFKDSVAIVAISAAIRDGIRSSESVPILIHLASSSSDPDIRGASVHALREIRTPLARNAFSRALNDSDQMVRYDAVMGLSELTGDMTHAPSVASFRHSEKESLTYWKQQPK
jgi:HEAT repeats